MESQLSGHWWRELCYRIKLYCCYPSSPESHNLLGICPRDMCYHMPKEVYGPKSLFRTWGGVVHFHRPLEVDSWPSKNCPFLADFLEKKSQLIYIPIANNLYLGGRETQQIVGGCLSERLWSQTWAAIIWPLRVWVSGNIDGTGHKREKRAITQRSKEAIRQQIEMNSGWSPSFLGFFLPESYLLFNIFWISERPLCILTVNIFFNLSSFEWVSGPCNQRSPNSIRRQGKNKQRLTSWLLSSRNCQEFRGERDPLKSWFSALLFF